MISTPFSTPQQSSPPTPPSFVRRASPENRRAAGPRNRRAAGAGIDTWPAEASPTGTRKEGIEGIAVPASLFTPAPDSPLLPLSSQLLCSHLSWSNAFGERRTVHLVHGLRELPATNDTKGQSAAAQDTGGGATANGHDTRGGLATAHDTEGGATTNGHDTRGGFAIAQDTEGVGTTNGPHAEERHDTEGGVPNPHHTEGRTAAAQYSDGESHLCSGGGEGPLAGIDAEGGGVKRRDPPVAQQIARGAGPPAELDTAGGLADASNTAGGAAREVDTAGAAACGLDTAGGLSVAHTAVGLAGAGRARGAGEMARDAEGHGSNSAQRSRDAISEETEAGAQDEASGGAPRCEVTRNPEARAKAPPKAVTSADSISMRKGARMPFKSPRRVGQGFG